MHCTALCAHVQVCAHTCTPPEIKHLLSAYRWRRPPCACSSPGRQSRNPETSRIHGTSASAPTCRSQHATWWAGAMCDALMHASQQLVYALMRVITCTDSHGQSQFATFDWTVLWKELMYKQALMATYYKYIYLHIARTFPLCELNNQTAAVLEVEVFRWGGFPAGAVAWSRRAETPVTDAFTWRTCRRTCVD